MRVRSGRLEKRIRLAVAVQISSPGDSTVTERATTENVCSTGMRVLTQGARQPDERLLVRLRDGKVRILARVIYCHRLPDGRCGVGLEFHDQTIAWQRASIAGAEG